MIRTAFTPLYHATAGNVDSDVNQKYYRTVEEVSFDCGRFGFGVVFCRLIISINRFELWYLMIDRQLEVHLSE